jgi:uncharacterized delta-60 repeat protein
MTISICLTTLGTLSQSAFVNIYSNLDVVTPIYTNIPVSSLFGANCSFIATIPDGTSSILLQQVDKSECFINLTILTSDFCDVCNLRFDVFSSSTVGRIVAGNLIDDCPNTSITDYIIDWYGPNSTTNIAFTSGKGTFFSGYAFTHPLINNTAIVANPGTYFPQIRKIRINGIVFTQSGGTGSAISDINSCFSGDTVLVSTLDCSNGVSDKSQYTHQISFRAVANGIPPQALQSTIELSSTTKYFAWAFRSFQIPDRIRFTFSGSSYSDPIVFEDLYVGAGGNLVTSPGFSNQTLSVNVAAKSASTITTQQYIPKVNVLTGLTINNGDKIFIDVTPNTSNFQTDWDLYINPCLTTFDCTNCIFDNNLVNERSFKLIGSSLALNPPDNCNKVSWRYQLSGCNDTYLQTDFFKYVFFGDVTNPNGATFNQTFFNVLSSVFKHDGVSIFTPTGISSLQNTGNVTAPRFNCSTPTGYDTAIPGSTTPLCAPPNDNYIRYTKQNIGPSGTGIFKMYFSDISDFNFYWTNINAGINAVFSQNIVSYNPLDFGYYTYLILQIPNAQGQTPCGDGVIPYIYNFHFTTVVTSGYTGGYYEIQLTMPTIQNQIPNVVCSNCTGITQYNVNKINNSSTGTTQSQEGLLIDFVSNKGSRYFTPYWQYFTVNGNIEYSNEASIGYQIAIPRYLNETYMYSGSPLTLIPSLTAQTCDLTNLMVLQPGGGYPSPNNQWYDTRPYQYTFYNLKQNKNIIRLNSNGTNDNTFVNGTSFNSNNFALGLQNDGGILVSGNFTQFNFVNINRICRLDSNGSLDTSFVVGTGFNSVAFDCLIQPDGSIIFGGIFTTYNGTPINRICRILPNGNIDTSFTIGGGFSNAVTTLALQPLDNKILVGGVFTSFNGTPRNYICRLNPNGTNDATFNIGTGFNGGVETICLLPSGKILVGGNFTSFNGTPTNYICRLNSDGTLDTTFNVGGSGFSNTVSNPINVRDIKLQSTGKLIVAGIFGSYNGVSVKKICRLFDDGTLDTTFNIGSVGPTPSFAYIFTIAIQSDDKIIIGGQFTQINNINYRGICRLEPDGDIDSTFIVGNGFNNSGEIQRILIQPDNKILVTGSFQQYGDAPNDFSDWGISTFAYADVNINPNFPIYIYSGGSVVYSDPNYIL